MAALNKLELSILIEDPYNPSILKKISHKRFIIDSDLEMSQEVEVVCYENNNGVAGLPMLQVIEANQNLTDEQKKKQLDTYRSYTFPTTTRGYMVDPLTGQQAQPIPQGQPNAGQYPEGVISELEYWQSMPKQTFEGSNLSLALPSLQFYPGDTMAELIYNGLLLSAAKMIERNRI